jgi:dGTPase
MCKPFDESAIYTNPRAALSANTKGRVFHLDPDGYRTAFQRDIHRIIYSQPFRRLRHKTQVFFLPHNDHICTRMEHVLHVSSASRTVARHLRLNEDLAEAIALGHDLGHAPFGHHGETVLNRLSAVSNLGVNFQHEIHGLRVVDKLAEFDRDPKPGLNLTYEVRDGIISHCGENFDRVYKPHDEEKDLDGITDRAKAGNPCTLEGCIVRMVDKIAYAGRDLEDGLRAGLIEERSIPSNINKILGANNGAIIGTLLEDLIEYTRINPDVIGLSEDKHCALKQLIDFNYSSIYYHDKVTKFKKQATRAIEELFTRLVDDLNKTDRLTKSLDTLPDASTYVELKRFIDKIAYNETDSNEMIILDFISGMTDNYVVYCLDEIFVPKHIT